MWSQKKSGKCPDVCLAPIWWWHLQSSDQSPVDKVMHWNLPCDWSLTGLYSLTSLPWKKQSCLLKANYLPKSSETVQGWHNLEPDVQSRSCTFETCFSIKAQFLSVFGCVTFHYDLVSRSMNQERYLYDTHFIMNLVFVLMTFIYTSG